MFSKVELCLFFAARSVQSRLFFFFSCDKGGQYNNTTLLMCSNRQRRTLQKMVCMDGSWVVKLPCNPKLQVRSLQR